MTEPEKSFVFLDQSGRRWPQLRKFGVILLILIGGSVLAFLGSLFISPPLPPSLAVIKKQIRAIQEHQLKVQRSPRTPWNQYAQNKKNRAPDKPDKLKERNHREDRPKEIRLGTIDSSSARSIDSLTRHANELTHVAMHDLTMSTVEGSLIINQDKETWELLKKNHLSHMAILSNDNEEEDDWTPEAVEYLAFGDAPHRREFIRRLVEATQTIEAQGVLIDWQGLDPTYQDLYTNLIHEISDALHAVHCELWLKVSVGEDLKAFDLPELSDGVDFFVAALHDENGQDDQPGPIASPDWFSGWLDALLREMDPEQWIVELGTYGYDWSASSKDAEEITFADAMTRARFSGADDVEVQAPDFNPSFSYSENGRDHTVWFLDAATFANQLMTLRKEGIRNVGMNRLGTEDPGIWQVLKEQKGAEIPHALLSKLEHISGSNVLTHLGQGEVVSVETVDPSDGQRKLAFHDGVLTENYLSFPEQPTLFHTGGEIPHQVVLTFDDGPDPKWTPKILDILRKFHVHATFFVLGTNAEKYPFLLQRIVAEGHEIGSHAFTHTNLATMPRRQVSLELNATQRIIEAATGHSTLLFRPPYDADSQLDYLPLLEPLQIAQDLGYLIVLEQIDPQDWSQPGTQEIIRRVDLQQSQGTILLLHDAGGNREQTVEALPKILEGFEKDGIKVVSVADILGTSNDTLMPKVTPQEHQTFAGLTSGLGFRALRFLGNLVWFFIIAATVMIGIRTLLILALALLHHRKKETQKNFTPPLSIVIPAYKEEKVIAATLQSLLQSHYPSDFEILVIDDGSPDRTAEEARRIALTHPSVRVLKQPNQGKAAALENGIRHTRNEILIFLDADTHFLPDTLTHLVAPLSDPTVGAVAGHPRVGNPRTLIARCQDIEYIVAFNLDRRALSHWNAVTVIPGAVSAFRKQALMEAGGFRHDTLAEDADLTLAIHAVGWRMECAPKAVALTEAPETVATLVKQRFRWALGTMQSVWKHRRQTFSHRNFALGWFSLPSIWLFQILLVASAPFIDLLFFQAAIMGHWDVVLPYFCVFLISDLVLAFAACLMEPVKWTQALRILPMRFIYRPILSYVIWKAIVAALRGAWIGWGKLDRTGNVVSSAATHPTSP